MDTIPTIAYKVRNTGYSFDSDGDTRMTQTQPVYEYIQAPRLVEWDQTSLIKWNRYRKQYVEKIKERCRVTNEDPDQIILSVKNSIEPKLLEHLARYVLEKDVKEVTDMDLVNEIDKCRQSLKNNHIPDVEVLFKDQLRMDLNIDDVSARVTKYFVQFDQIIEEHGLQSMLSPGYRGDDSYKDRMKNRCKMLMSNLAPKMLKKEIERLVQLEHRSAKSDDVKLFKLIVEKAKTQQHFHLMMTEERVKKPSLDNKLKKNQNQKMSITGITKVEGKVKSKPRNGCWICKGDHWASECPNATQAQKDTAQLELQRMKDKKYVSKTRRAKEFATYRSTVTLNQLLEVPLCPDWGADVNVIPSQVVQELQQIQPSLKVQPLPDARLLKMANGSHAEVQGVVLVDLRINTAAGPVKVCSQECVVMDTGDDEFLLGKPTMQYIGIDVDRNLEQLAGLEVDFDEETVLTELPDIGKQDFLEIDQDLEHMLQECENNGLSGDYWQEIRGLIYRHRDEWRTQLAPDEPAMVTPLEVQIKEGSSPHRCASRKYSPIQREFLRDQVQQLLQYGFIYRNDNSRWAAAAVPVEKPGKKAEYRLAIDYRPNNNITIPIAGALPNFAVITSHLKNAKYFARFDFFKGFWQFPLAPESQEFFSFLVDGVVYTPRRVPQGASDSAIHFQKQMELVFQEMLYTSLLIWIDDVVVYATTLSQFIFNLTEFFRLVKKHKLKLHPGKCELFNTTVRWCGKVFDGEGIRHDPSRLKAIQALPAPRTAADLMHFICATNWLRDSIVDYARVIAPLQDKLTKLLPPSKKTKRYAASIQLDWNPEDQLQFETVLQHVAASSKLWFPDDTATLCLFTDASEKGWAVVLTQVKEWKTEESVQDQQHELIICQGGMFNNASVNWSMTEKEGYPIVKACVELEYLLQRQKGFTIYCDHSNLIHIFSPSENIKKHVRGKLLRWSMKLMGLHYEIVHIAGENNIWADIISRWMPKQAVEAVCAVRTRKQLSNEVSRLRPLQDEAFRWPSTSELKQIQQQSKKQIPAESNIKNEVVYVNDKLWIPEGAQEFIQRVMIIAHCGLHGHRGKIAMEKVINSIFSIAQLSKKMDMFLKNCLLCKHVREGKLIQRPWDEHVIAKERNEVLHMDFCYMGESYGSTKYILVLKDELTHFCELVACDSASSDVAAAAIMDWNKRFGLPMMWMSDCGSHFKNQLMGELSARLQTEHKFSPVYSPWINGTVERLNRDLLKVVRVMLLESGLDTRNWEYLLPLVQANLNSTAVDSLNKYSPMELFTGLKPTSALDTFIVDNKDDDNIQIHQMNMDGIIEKMKKLQVSLTKIHQQVVDKKERRQLYEMANKNSRVVNFHVGDYVLWSRIDPRLAGNKLMVQWVGPFEVIEALPHSFIIRSLLTQDKFDVHASRLQLYDDATLNITEELKTHIALQGIILGVNEIVEHRYNESIKQFEVLVDWQGLEECENSWEPLKSIYKDVPIKVQEYGKKLDPSEYRKMMESVV